MPESESENNELPDHFFLDDVMKFFTMAGKSILQDEFGKCFQPQPRRKYRIFSLMWPIWICSIFIRYGVLLPVRISILLTCSMAALSVLVPLAWISPRGGTPLMDVLLHYAMQGILMSLATRVTYHGCKPNPKQPHLFVANHTSVTDFGLASGMGRMHAVVAQAHGGVFGWICRVVLRPLSGSLLFDRNESRDRAIITQKMKKHVSDPRNNPLLIFPEGTCVNNEYTVLFHKGAFELDCLVCPIAIKYDKSFGDPYFNTREQSFMQHLLYLMTRWVNPVNVYWIPPQKLQLNESSVEFSDRVKALISETAGLKNLSWDGYLKNYRPNNEKQNKMRLETRQEYLKQLSTKLNSSKDFSSTICDEDEEFPNLPEKDYLPEWLSEDNRTNLQNELLQCTNFNSTSSSLTNSNSTSNSNSNSNIMKLSTTNSDNENNKNNNDDDNEKLNRSMENLGKKFKELRDTFKTSSSSSII